MSDLPAPNTPSRLSLIAAFAAVYLIWGSTYLAIRFAVETIPPFLMAGTRVVIAGALLYAWMRLCGKPRPERHHWGNAAIAGGLMLLGGTGAVAWAEQRIPSGVAALLVATVPLWMVLLDWWRPGGVQPGIRVIVGLVLGLAGIVLLVGPGEFATGSINPIGAGVVMFGAFSWAIGSLYSQQGDLPESPLLATAITMLTGGVLLIVAGSLTGEWARLEWHAVSLGSLLSLVYLIIFGSLVAFSAYIWLLQVTTPARAATYAYVNPIVAVILGWILGNEPLGWRTALAAAIIVTAVVLITMRQAQDEKPG